VAAAVDAELVVVPVVLVLVLELEGLDEDGLAAAGVELDAGEDGVEE
jgi:hypothetical protein